MSNMLEIQWGTSSTSPLCGADRQSLYSSNYTL